jgi:hypothetical protein
MSLVGIALNVLSLLVGYVAGFVTFRRSHTWCPSCGAGLRCLECTNRTAVRLPAGSHGRNDGLWQR